MPVQYFGVTLDLDRTDPHGHETGARVRAMLEVENRTNAFSIPRQAVFEKNGKKMVYVKRRSASLLGGHDRHLVARSGGGDPWGRQG